jgi:putative peptidoglycan lipid II flippase
MNSPMREVEPSQTPGGRLRQDADLSRGRPPSGAPGGAGPGPASEHPVPPGGTSPPGGPSAAVFARGDTAPSPRDTPQRYPGDTPAAFPGDTPDPDGPMADGPAPPDAGLVRASGVMAAGTLVSRITGFMRTAVIAYALGTAAVADAYNNANTFPNAVFDLLLGGILTSVFVPLLVNAAKRDADGGRAYDQRMFTLVTIALAVITVVATIGAPVLVTIYASSVHGPERDLMVTLARFFIPQIFFYGISALAGAILNARSHFAAPMWTPVVNNIVVIVMGVAFMIVVGTGVTLSTITPGEVRFLGVGTTLGIVAQTAALIPALRRVGFRWHPRLDLRRDEMAEIAQMAGWMFAYVVTTQIGLLVTQNLANNASVHANAEHVGYGAGFSAYQYAWVLFQFPYAIVGISVITALLPRMSAHVADGSYALVRQDFSSGVRLASVITVPGSVVLAVLAAPLAIMLLGHGSTTVPDATFVGELFAVFSAGLVPYMLFQLLLRVFYAMHDSRTTAFIGVAVMAVNIAVNVLAWALLPPGQVTAGLAAGFGVANVAGTAAAWWILRKRTGGLDGKRIAWTLVRTLLAALPAAVFAIAMAMAVGVVFHPGTVNGFLTALFGGAGALLIYLLFARAFGVTELSDLAATVTGRFSGRFGGGRHRS